MKTRVLYGAEVSVVYSDGQIVAAVEKGKLTIMNENLGIIKEFTGTRNRHQLVCGNATYLALGDASGSVRYYKRDSDVEPKVILLNCQYCSKVF